MRLSYLSLICRLAIGITLFFTFAPPRYFTWLVCLIFLVSFTLATVAYELVRRATDQLFLKIMSGGDDYLLATDSRLLTFSSLSVVAVVGIGYAIRCLLGLWLLAGFSLRVQLFLGLFAWSYGSMFVYMTWIIESTKTSLTAFTSKAHLLSLGYPFRERFARIESRNSGASGVNAKDKVLSVSQSPWTVLVLLGAISQILMAFLLKVFIFGSFDSERWFFFLLVNVVVMIGVMTLPIRRVLLASVFMLITLVATVLSLPIHGITWPQRSFALIAIGCAPVTAFTFRVLCDEDIEDSIFKFMGTLRVKLIVVPKWFGGIGSATVENSTLD